MAFEFQAFSGSISEADKQVTLAVVRATVPDWPDETNGR